MDRLLNIIKKILLTANWFFCGFVGILCFIFSNTFVEDTVNQEKVSPYLNEWWFSFLTLFSQNPSFSMMIWIGIGFIVIGIILHYIIDWIFE